MIANPSCALALPQLALRLRKLPSGLIHRSFKRARIDFK
jgi:hypothetical protein